MKKKLMNMTKEQQAKCHIVIHSASASAAAVGAGLAQIPCSDNLVIAPIQIAMTVALGKVFGISLTSSAAESFVATAASTAVGRAASQVLLGWIPGLGNVINACTASAITETMGWILANDFACMAEREGEAA